MPTFAFAQTPNQPRELVSSSLARSNSTTSGAINHKHSVLDVQGMKIGNQAAQRLSQAEGEELEVGLSGGASRFAHDFSPIPVHSTARGTQTHPAINQLAHECKQAGDGREEMISHPGPLAIQVDFASIAPMQIQRKLTISSAGDPFEREADDVAEKVMRMVEPTPISSAPSAIRRKCKACEGEEKKLIHTDRLEGAGGGGEPLPAATRQRMENAFGYDFSGVRVHQNPEAGELSRQLSAFAFTRGRHIYFGNGMYDPLRSTGTRLLAHELTHVVQQGHAAPLGNGMAAIPSSTVQSSTPDIQRFSYFEGKSLHEVNNLADTALYEKDVGLTFALLNGKPIKKGADVRAALKRPTLNITPAAAGGFDARVQSVPTNVFRADETVLAARSWKLDVTKAAIGRKYPSLTACRGTGRTIFQAFGDSGDPAMFTASRRHEDHHADAFFGAFMNAFYWWDTELDVAGGRALLKDPAGTYHGPTKAAAETALFKAMGGTPDEMADKFTDFAADAINSYHGTTEGGPVICNNSTATADATCSTSSVECNNPS